MLFGFPCHCHSTLVAAVQTHHSHPIDMNKSVAKIILKFCVTDTSRLPLFDQTKILILTIFSWAKSALVKVRNKHKIQHLPEEEYRS
jgi:hypothetical protein